MLQIPQHGRPAVSALPRAIVDGDEPFRAIAPHANHHARAEANLLEADAEPGLCVSNSHEGYAAFCPCSRSTTFGYISAIVESLRRCEDGKRTFCLSPTGYNGHQGGHMRISTVREFRDKATGLLRSRTPILVTRRGRLAGIFFPRPEITLPIELKRELYDMLSSDVARQLKRRKVSEEDVLEDFEASRTKRRATRRRR